MVIDGRLILSAGKFLKSISLLKGTEDFISIVYFSFTFSLSGKINTPHKQYSTPLCLYYHPSYTLASNCSERFNHFFLLPQHWRNIAQVPLRIATHKLKEALIHLSTEMYKRWIKVSHFVLLNKWWLARTHLLSACAVSVAMQGWEDTEMKKIYFLLLSSSQLIVNPNTKHSSV